MLGYSSGLLRQIFQTSCDLPTYLDFTYDLICPGFEPEAMKRILEILYTGETYINTYDVKLYKDMRSILSALQISMILPDLAAAPPPPEQFLGIKQEPVFEEPALETESLNVGEFFQPLICSFCDEAFQHSEEYEKHLESHSSIVDDVTVDETDLEAESLDEVTML